MPWSQVVCCCERERERGAVDVSSTKLVLAEHSGAGTTRVVKPPWVGSACRFHLGSVDNGFWLVFSSLAWRCEGLKTGLLLCVCARGVLVAPYGAHWPSPLAGICAACVNMERVPTHAPPVPTGALWRERLAVMAWLGPVVGRSSHHYRCSWWGTSDQWYGIWSQGPSIFNTPGHRASWKSWKGTSLAPHQGMGGTQGNRTTRSPFSYVTDMLLRFLGTLFESPQLWHRGGLPCSLKHNWDA